mmetsp:Transcript_14386/g.32861  ORF Transcript_14386/g.32861 Transcript_14386/m.32861 type:complete len:269 (+) Transcript_14386:1267-2073(+)
MEARGSGRFRQDGASARGSLAARFAASHGIPTRSSQWRRQWSALACCSCCPSMLAKAAPPSMLPKSSARPPPPLPPPWRRAVWRGCSAPSSSWGRACCGRCPMSRALRACAGITRGTTWPAWPPRGLRARCCCTRCRSASQARRLPSPRGEWRPSPSTRASRTSSSQRSDTFACTTSRSRSLLRSSTRVSSGSRPSTCTREETTCCSARTTSASAGSTWTCRARRTKHCDRTRSPCAPLRTTRSCRSSPLRLTTVCFTFTTGGCIRIC